MTTRNINTRSQARTSDMTPESDSMTTYHFPSLGVSVEAGNYQDALVKAKEVYKAAKADSKE